MRTLFGVDALSSPPQGTVVTIGTFDGVHAGHRALIAATIASARGCGAHATVVTWDRHPFATLRPDKVPLLLTSQERKIELLAETGIDLLAVLAFDDDLARTPAERFVTQVLHEGLGARAVLVGEDWRFGYKAAGDVGLLRSMGEELGFSVEGLRLSEVDNAPASATRIRDAIASGDMGLAATLLGRPFDVDGVVLSGDRRGTELGYPTANLAVDHRFAHPPRGVYGGRARTLHGWHPAAINLGVNPTFGGDPDSSPWRVEAYLLDFSGDLYDQSLRVEFHERLRDEEKFESVGALLDQMAEDVRQVRATYETPKRR